MTFCTVLATRTLHMLYNSKSTREVPQVTSPSFKTRHSLEQNHWLPPPFVQLQFQSCLRRASVKILSIFAYATWSVHLHSHPLQLVTAPQSVHTICRQGHVFCLLQPWRGALTTAYSLRSGELYSPSGPPLGSGLCCVRRVVPAFCGVAPPLLSCSTIFSRVPASFCINSVFCTQSCALHLVVTYN